MRFSGLLVTAVISLAAPSRAQCSGTIVNIDARQIGVANPIQITLQPGCWKFRPIDPSANPGGFTAWNAWGTTSGCTSQGTGCSTGWSTQFFVHLGNQKLVGGLGDTPRYGSPAIAFTQGSSDTITLDVPAVTTVGLSCGDFFLADNQGGVSLCIEAASPPALTFTTFGTNCGPSLPVLTLYGCMAPGESLVFHVHNQAQASPFPGGIAFGFSQALIPLGGGCNVLINPVLGTLPFARQYTFGAAAGAGAAMTQARLVVPPTLNLAGVVLMCQAFVLNTSAPLGLELTNAVLIQ